METIWDRLGDLKDSFYSNVEQRDETTLPTKTVKIALAIYFAQNVVISLIWAIKDSMFWPILFVFAAFLQVGWFWNNITESWRQRATDTTVEKQPDDDGLSNDGRHKQHENICLVVE